MKIIYDLAMMPVWNADAHTFGAYDSLNRIEDDEKWIKCKTKTNKLKPKTCKWVVQIFTF